jgi:DNA-binding GntR family transcriptional regulator
LPRAYRKDQQVPQPLYKQIADDLRAKIDDGRLGPGDQLPTQEALIEEWRTRLPGAAISRGTVRRALEELVLLGLVVSRRPVGVFVRDRRRIVVRPQQEFGRHFATLVDFFVDQVSEQAADPSQEIDVRMVRPPAHVAERLRTGDAVVVARMRVRSVNGERYDLNDSYYPPDVVQGSEVMNPDDIARGVNKLLDELGYPQVLLVDEYVARMATTEEAQRLDLPPGTAVLEQIVTGYLGDKPDSRPVRCAVTVYPGDRYRLIYERRRKVKK